ncbi:C4-dicarboxylate ABC transporter [Campylobacter jejuni]|nr:C4-dicarboxylate ABC transporter [Campylobacter jejuni]EDP4303908.1 C4-dicarboxylate ABC transporter [Campylobacter jejuni]
MDRKKIPLLVLCILIAAVFWLVPTPVGLEDNSWHFLAVIMAVILQVMPFIAIAIVALSGYYHYPIENLSKIYTKATSKTSTQQLIDETKISFKYFST